MNKEDILARSRSENKNGDERELRIREHSHAVSAGFAGALCFIMLMLEELIFDRSATVIWVVYTGMESVNAVTRALQSKLRKDKVYAAVWALLFAAFMVFYFIEGFGK